MTCTTWATRALLALGVVVAAACGSSEGVSSDPLEESIVSATAATETPPPTADGFGPAEAEPSENDLPPTATSVPDPAPEPTEATVSGPYVVSEIDDPAHLELGGRIYAATCASCHGQQGTGTPKGPSLTGLAAEEPDRGLHLDIVSYGRGDMLGRAQELSPAEIDAVVSYMRLTFVELG